MLRPSFFAGSRGGPTARAPSGAPLRGASFRGKILSPSVSPALRSLMSFLWVLALATALGAQPPAPPAAGEVVLQAYTFQHQQASEAVALVYPLLSPKGTVEVQPRGNTLVIRDTPAALARILPALRGFDRPARPMRLEMFIVRVSRDAVSPQLQRSDLPAQLTKRLRALLAYDVFEMQAQAQLTGVEGQQVIYEMGQGYKVSFRFGNMTADQQVKLLGFRIARQGEGQPERVLLQANVPLQCDQTMSLGLAKSEASREALMLVLTLREGDAPRRKMSRMRQ
jgi:type II/III secretion system protein